MCYDETIKNVYEESIYNLECTSDSIITKYVYKLVHIIMCSYKKYLIAVYAGEGFICRRRVVT